MASAAQHVPAVNVRLIQASMRDRVFMIASLVGIA
jgi:hypothetical protein